MVHNIHEAKKQYHVGWSACSFLWFELCFPVAMFSVDEINTVGELVVRSGNIGLFHTFLDVSTATFTGSSTSSNFTRSATRSLRMHFVYDKSLTSLVDSLIMENRCQIRGVTLRGLNFWVIFVLFHWGSTNGADSKLSENPLTGFWHFHTGSMVVLTLEVRRTSSLVVVTLMASFQIKGRNKWGA